MTFFRRLAQLGMDATLRILPPSSGAWGTAMAREFDEIADDRKALTWAVGCFDTAVTERLGASPRTLGLLRGVIGWSTLIYNVPFVAVYLVWLFGRRWKPDLLADVYGGLSRVEISVYTLSAFFFAVAGWRIIRRSGDGALRFIFATLLCVAADVAGVMIHPAEEPMGAAGLAVMTALYGWSAISIPVVWWISTLDRDRNLRPAA